MIGWNTISCGRGEKPKVLLTMQKDLLWYAVHRFSTLGPSPPLIGYKGSSSEENDHFTSSKFHFKKLEGWRVLEPSLLCPKIGDGLFRSSSDSFSCIRRVRHGKARL